MKISFLLYWLFQQNLTMLVLYQLETENHTLYYNSVVCVWYETIPTIIIYFLISFCTKSAP